MSSVLFIKTNPAIQTQGSCVTMGVEFFDKSNWFCQLDLSKNQLVYGRNRVNVHGVQLWIFVMNQQFFELSKKWKQNKEVDKEIN